MGCMTKSSITGVVEHVEFLSDPWTIVTFMDGRKIAFAGITGEVLQVGQTNTILYQTYDGRNQVLSVTIGE